VTAGRRRTFIVWAALAAIVAGARPARAHSGPAFPIVSTETVGAYHVAVWTDPDSTDDGSAAGRFWVTIGAAQDGVALPPATRVIVTIAPTDRPGPAVSAPAMQTGRDPASRFVALLMDHEGPYRVQVAIDGPLGRADVDSAVDATYDLRPAPLMMIVFLMPFVLAGFLWIKLLVRRRRRTTPGR
jgi:hypothetical protein